MNSRPEENLKLLLKWRADLNAVDVETGETALIRACSEGDILRVKKLVGMRANVRKADATGATPLHVVCGETKLMEPSWDNRDLRNSVCDWALLKESNLNYQNRDQK